MLSPLKQKIVDAVPEILELKFGCVVAVSTPEFRNIIVDKINQDIKHTKEMSQRENAPDYTANTYFITRGFLQTKKERILGKKNIGNVFILEEILGRPIRLSNIILTFKIKNEKKKYVPIVEEYGEILKQWNLAKDNLDDQSPECIAFLEKILL